MIRAYCFCSSVSSGTPVSVKGSIACELLLSTLFDVDDFSTNDSTYSLSLLPP